MSMVWLDQGSVRFCQTRDGNKNNNPERTLRFYDGRNCMFAVEADGLYIYRGFSILLY